MQQKKTKIMIVAPTFYSAFQAEVSKHLRRLLKPEEMVLRSVTGDEATQKERLRMALKQSNPSALIAISIQPDAETIAVYSAAGIPIVLIDEEAGGVSTITTDNLMGGRLAGEHLVSRGRKKIGIVSGRIHMKGGYNAEQRLKGFQQALKIGKIPEIQGQIVEVAQYSRDEGVAVMPQLLEAGLDAVFCAAGDNCALGLLTVARKRGIKIPGDFSIVGFDDLLAARVSVPPLTTIRQPLDKMAEAAYDLAVNRCEEILHKPKKAVFTPELLIRKTS